jgi:hypothetical protein
MSRPEYVGDEIRRAWLKQVHATSVVPWGLLADWERRKWIALATVALNADACYRPR